MREVYFSDKLNRYFDTKEECLQEEALYDKYVEERNRRKQEKEAELKFLEDEFNEVYEARKKVSQMYEEYLKHKDIFERKYNCRIGFISKPER